MPIEHHVFKKSIHRDASVFSEVVNIAEAFTQFLRTPEIEHEISNVHKHGATSTEIQKIVLPRATELRFTSEKKQLFSRYSERLAEADMEPSVGSKGDSYDNALAETINGLYKAELIHRRAPWKTKESVELATLQWVHWFNHHRLLEPIGYIPPAEAERNYYRQLASQTAMPA